MRRAEDAKRCPGWESPCSALVYGEADYCSGCIGTRRILQAVSRRPMPDEHPAEPDDVPVLPQDSGAA